MENWRLEGQHLKMHRMGLCIYGWEDTLIKIVFSCGKKLTSTFKMSGMGVGLVYKALDIKT